MPDIFDTDDMPRSLTVADIEAYDTACDLAYAERRQREIDDLHEIAERACKSIDRVDDAVTALKQTGAW